MPTEPIKVPMLPDQRAKVDSVRGKISRAAFIREAVRYYLKEVYRVELGPDAPNGGPRERRL